MLRNKKRKSLNYSYKPQSLKLNNDDEIVIQPNKINAFETIVNTHEFNRTMLKQAYENKNSIVGIGNKAWIAGTHNIRDVYDDIVHVPNWNKDQQFSKNVGLISNFIKTPEIGLSIGNSKEIQRYKQLDDFMKIHPETNELISHSLGSTVSLEYGKDKPNIKNFTYGAPVIDNNKNQNTTRYRQAYDPISSLDKGARTIPTTNPLDILQNHSYNNFYGTTQNTLLGDGTQILIE